MNSTLKSLLFWVALAVIVLLIWSLATNFNRQGEDVPFSMFVEKVKKDEVDKVTFTGNAIVGEYMKVAPASPTGTTISRTTRTTRTRSPR